jgi:hypothetical protein
MPVDHGYNAVEDYWGYGLRRLGEGRGCCCGEVDDKSPQASGAAFDSVPDW